MSTALVLSLLIHALLLSLTFGNQGVGLPSLDFPWRERRFEAGDLHVALLPGQVTAATPALIEPSANLTPTDMAMPEPIAAPGAMAVMTQSPAGESESVASPPTPVPALIASEQSDTATLVAPVTPVVVATPVIAPAPSATSPAVVLPTPRDESDAAQKQIESDVRERAFDLDELNRAKQEVQQQAERLEAARQAAVREEEERAQATRVDADRLEAARQDTARQERELQKAARAEQEAKREAVLRAIGRQLDEEAARRDAPSSSTARRGRLFGRTDSNVELILYAEAWSRKIDLNMTIDMVCEAAKQRHTNPLVTVALRSDGLVESVTFVVSSGVAEIDEAIRRIVQSQSPYRSFSPALARDYDVIEIRRSWSFDMAVRLF